MIKGDLYDAFRLAYRSAPANDPVLSPADCRYPCRRVMVDVVRDLPVLVGSQSYSVHAGRMARSELS